MVIRLFIIDWIVYAIFYHFLGQVKDGNGKCPRILHRMVLNVKNIVGLMEVYG